jgi:hypothetical protein
VPTEVFVSHSHVDQAFAERLVGVLRRGKPTVSLVSSDCCGCWRATPARRSRCRPSLDRLHTFIIKYVRSLCETRDISVARDKPLHSLFGEYVKHLKQGGHFESRMTERILKSSISTLEAFNDVRNNRSLAHDNPILGYEEALLIFNHVAASVRFLRSIHTTTRERERAATADDDIPF